MRWVIATFAAVLLCGCAQPELSSPDTRVTTNQTSATLVVGNKGEDTVSFIDLATGKEIARQPSGPMPHEVAISPDGKTVAVVAYGGSSIDFYDAATTKQLETLDISPNIAPHGLLWLDDDRLLATTERSKTLTIISAPDSSGKRSVTGIDSQTKGHMVAVTPDYRYAYTADLDSGNIAMIDLTSRSLVKAVPAGPGAEGIAVTNDGTEVWATARGTNKAYVYNSKDLTKVAEIEIGEFPLRIIPSPDGKYMVTSNLVAGSLSVIDIESRNMLRTIEVTGQAEDQQVTILFSPDGKRIYVALTGPDKIAEIDLASGKILRLIDAGKDGDGLAIIPAR